MSAKENVKLSGTMIAVVGLGLGIVAVALSGIYALNRAHLGYSVIIGCLGYLYLRKFLINIKAREGYLKWQESNMLFVLGAVISIGLLLASVSLLDGQGYRRSTGYFLLFLASVVVLVLQISTMDISPVWKRKVLLAQILLVAVSFRAGAYFLYPSVSGNDPFFHQGLVESIAGSYSIPEDQPYRYFPAMHILATVAG